MRSRTILPLFWLALACAHHVKPGAPREEDPPFVKDGAAAVLTLRATMLLEAGGQAMVYCRYASAFRVGDSLLTAAHAVDDARRFSVETKFGYLPVEVVEVFPLQDVAILKMQSSSDLAFLPPPLPMGKASSAPQPGRRVFAFGISSGTIRTEWAPRPFLTHPRRQEIFMRFKAVARGGDSGGPVLDETGAVVGLISAIVRDPGGFTVVSPVTLLLDGHPL